ncbi:hypothetical protein [Halorubellus salinus]|uniref:hypothetical protein n=1 Tax=Halorubellus salinus TaxID=755309 RepID=UPI001D080A84|nr:hypothetical protein [Halorubellus salinus]
MGYCRGTLDCDPFARRGRALAAAPGSAAMIEDVRERWEATAEHFQAEADVDVALN